MNVKATKSPEGYLLSLGSASVMAVRQPDLYFVIVVDGQEHKGYLKDLKTIFAKAQGMVTVDIENQPPVVEDKVAQGMDGVKRRKRYTTEGSNVADDQDDPLPTMDATGELLVENATHEVRAQRPSARFPYPDGWAIIEKSTRLQHGWTKDRGRAMTILNER